MQQEGETASSSAEQRTGTLDQPSRVGAVCEPESPFPALDTGSQGQDTGSQGQDTGSQGQDTGSQDQDTGSQGQDTGSQGQDTGSQGQDTGNHGQDTAATTIAESQRTTGQDTTVSRDDLGVPMEVGSGEEGTTPTVTADCEPTSKVTATNEGQASAQLEPIGESETREGEVKPVSSSVGVSNAAGGTAVGTGEESACSGDGSEGTVQRPSVSILGK